MSSEKRGGIVGAIVSNADTIIAVAKWALPASFTGALVGWATWFTGLFSQYAPASWVFAGVLGAFVGTLIALFSTVVRERLQLLKFRNGVFEVSQINPLDKKFDGRRIRLVDLAPPVGPYIDGKTFIDCEILGPANVMFQDCHFQQNTGNITDGILIRPGFQPSNGFGFRGCTFTRCRFYLLSFMIPEPEFQFFANNHPYLNWITEKANEPPLPLNQVTDETQATRLG